MTLLTSLHEEVSLRSLLFWYTSLLSRSIALPPSPSFPVQEIPFYNVENGRMNPIPALLAATRTLYLFTKSDVKTILLPVVSIFLDRFTSRLVLKKQLLSNIDRFCYNRISPPLEPNR